MNAPALTPKPVMIALGSREPVTGRVVLSAKQTLPTAEAYVNEFHDHPDGRTIHHWAGEFWAWQRGRYVPLEDAAINHRLQGWLHDALHYVWDRQRGESVLMSFEGNVGTIRGAAEAVKAFVHLPMTTTPPAWLDHLAGRPEPADVIAFPRGLLDVNTRQVLPATPALFVMNGIDFDYDAAAPTPTRWLQFLDDLWGADAEQVRLLQQWFGYVLTNDTRQQKALLLVGPKRSGKGTIGRILTRLVGAGNVIGPTVGSLAGPFGLQPLIGKSLAIVSDARFSGEGAAIVTERLLCISGEDSITIDRKHLTSLTMRLPTRFMLLSNELPTLKDAAGALAGRFLPLKLTQSFYGNEDPTLERQLLDELPGILLWALDGLDDLRTEGRFIRPAATEQMIRDLEELTSPITAFLRDCCDVGPGKWVWVDDLYRAWKDWCDQDGRLGVGTKQTFGRDLAAASPGVNCRRDRFGRFYEGVELQPGATP